MVKISIINKDNLNLARLMCHIFNFIGNTQIFFSFILDIYVRKLQYKKK